MARKNNDQPHLNEREIKLMELLVEGNGKDQIASSLSESGRNIDRILNSIISTLANYDPKLNNPELGTIGRIACVIRVYTTTYLPIIRAEVKEKEQPQDAKQMQPQKDADVPGGLLTVPLFRHKVISKLVMSDDKNQIQHDTQLTVQCLQDRVDQTHHGLMIDDRSLEADASITSLSAWSETKGVEITSELHQDTKKPLFYLKFNPPLTRGQQIIYHWQTISGNYFPMTISEIRRRIENDQYPFVNEEAAEKGFSINTPTGNLYQEITFPESFGVKGEHIIAKWGQNGPNDKEEEERLLAIGALQRTVFAKRISIILNVPSPLFRHRYIIRWQPEE